MKIEHDPIRKMFWVDLGPYQAVLLYSKQEKVLDFYHIYVPDPYRNQGIAAKLLIAAFEYASKEGYRIVPTCPFIVSDFLPRFEAYQSLTEPGSFPFAGPF